MSTISEINKMLSETFDQGSFNEEYMHENFTMDHPMTGQKSREDFVAWSKAFYESFPDITVKMQATKQMDDGRYQCKNHPCGTHTGAPFGIPGHPKVPASNKTFSFQEYPILTMKDGKIFKVEFDERSNHGGAVHVYAQIGGFETCNEICGPGVQKLWRETFDGGLIPENLHENFEFDHGAVGVLDKNAYAEMMAPIYASFPDISFPTKIVKQENGIIEMIVQPKGTHTGAPFGLPGHPAIEAKNVKVENPPEHCWVEMKDGKFLKMRFDENSKLGGPAGLYRQIGGKMNA